MARVNTVKSFRGTSKTADGTLKCSKCGATIQRGDRYVWWANRAPGQRSSFRRIRCGRTECYPQAWEREGNPKRAMLMQATAEAERQVADWTDDPSEIISIMETLAESVREVAQEYEDGADNIESGFGHETYQSEELREKAQQLNDAADEVEQFDPSEDPPDEGDFEADEDDPDAEPENADGETYEEALETWRERVREEAYEKIGEVELP